MRVLITGATGFAGRHLAALAAERGADVIGLGRRPVPELDPSLTLAAYRSADLRDREAVRRVVRDVAPDRIFHLGAAASVGASWRAPAETIETNLIGTLAVLEATRAEAPDASVLIAGSGEEYGIPERLPVTEDHPLRPRNPYAIGKAGADMLGDLYAEVHGLRVIRMRAFNHTGPGQSDTYVVSSFARQIATAEAAGMEEVAIITGNLEPRRDFADVRDVVRAYWMALDGAASGAYNVCAGQAVQIADILRRLGELTGVSVRQHTDPELLSRDHLAEIRGSHERLTVATGWRPEIPLETTIADTLDWWRSRLRREVRASRSGRG